MNTPTTPPADHHNGRYAAEAGQPRTAAAVAVVDDVIQAVEDVALLLHQAALAAWEIGDREGITSELHYLGLGVYLAQGNAVALLPTDHIMSQSWPLPAPPGETDPARIVRSAESRLRSIPAEAVHGLSDLVLEVCDLVREFGDHDA